MAIPYKRTPCKNCPFRTDSLKGWLGENRMKEILEQDSFVCHKTTNGTDKDRMQCAGHMILKKDDNCFVRVSKVIGTDLDLKGQELIFKSEEDCVNHHKNKYEN